MVHAHGGGRESRSKDQNNQKVRCCDGLGSKAGHKIRKSHGWWNGGGQQERRSEDQKGQMVGGGRQESRSDDQIEESEVQRWAGVGKGAGQIVRRSEGSDSWGGQECRSEDQKVRWWGAWGNRADQKHKIGRIRSPDRCMVGWGKGTHGSEDHIKRSDGWWCAWGKQAGRVR